jgi:hypothetical protein
MLAFDPEAWAENGREGEDSGRPCDLGRAPG